MEEQEVKVTHEESTMEENTTEDASVEKEAAEGESTESITSEENVKDVEEEVSEQEECKCVYNSCICMPASVAFLLSFIVVIYIALTAWYLLELHGKLTLLETATGMSIDDAITYAIAESEEVTCPDNSHVDKKEVQHSAPPAFFEQHENNPGSLVPPDVKPFDQNDDPPVPRPEDVPELKESDAPNGYEEERNVPAYEQPAPEQTAPIEQKAYIDIAGRTVSEEEVESCNIPMGVYIVESTPGGAADIAGIKTGNIVSGIDDMPVTTIEELKSILAQHNIGDHVILHVFVPAENEYSFVEKDFNVTLTDGTLTLDRYK